MYNKRKRTYDSHGIGYGHTNGMDANATLSFCRGVQQGTPETKCIITNKMYNKNV